METWPAHASGNAASSTSVALTRNKQLVVVNDEEMGKPRVIPKPKFLDQLEGFLKKELRALGVMDVQPDDLRLQVKICINIGDFIFLKVNGIMNIMYFTLHVCRTVKVEYSTDTLYITTFYVFKNKVVIPCSIF